MVRIRVENGAVFLPVKVVPGASRTRYLDEWDERAKFAVAAPPEKGKANQALVAFLADLLKVHRRSIAVVSGETSPQKTIRIEGVTADAVRAALQPVRS